MSIKTFKENNALTLFVLLSAALHTIVFFAISTELPFIEKIAKAPGERNSDEPLYVGLMELPQQGGSTSSKATKAKDDTASIKNQPRDNAVEVTATGEAKRRDLSGESEQGPNKNAKDESNELKLNPKAQKGPGNALEATPLTKPQGATVERSATIDTEKLFPSTDEMAELSRLYELEQNTDNGPLVQSTSKYEGNKKLDVSLYTSELKYQEYLFGVKKKIKFYWYYPNPSARRLEQGKVRINFLIKSDGSVAKKELEMVKSTGYPALDDAAITAIKLASPFNPFPEDFEIDELDIRASFEYVIITTPQGP